MSQQLTYQVLEPGGRFIPTRSTLPPLAPERVRIQITHCGVCHSDLHMLDNDWDDTIYPLTPGHEIVGRIISAENPAFSHRLGEIVGVSWQQGACGYCTWCTQQESVFCADLQAIGLGATGGYAEFIDVLPDYLFSLPTHLTPAEAAPLLCAGTTVFNALQKYLTRPGMHIGIIGIGGLGHLAIQYARAMGATVTAFDKRVEIASDTLRLGAHQFIASDNIQQAQPSFDFLLSTVPDVLDYEPYIRLLKPKTTLCLLGIPKGLLSIPVFSLIIGEKSIAAMPLGSPKTVRAALDFAERHKICPWVTTLPMSHINEAFQKIKTGDVCYRIVLEA